MEKRVGQWRNVRHTAAWFVDSPPEPAATEAEVAASEKRLGRALPPLLAAMLRQSRCWSWRGPEEDVVWMSPGELAMGARAEEQGVEWAIDAAGPGVDPVYDSPQRLTFAYSDARVFQIDLSPPVGGSPGQVVAYDPEEGRVDVVAPSLDAFLAEGLRCLGAGSGGSDDERSGRTGAADAQAAGAPTSAKSLQDLFAAMDAAGDPAALKAMLAAMGGGAPADDDDDDDDDPEQDDTGTPSPIDPGLAAAVGRAAARFVGAFKQASPSLLARLKAPLAAPKARALLAKSGKPGRVPDALLPLFAAFNGQKGGAPLLPCPAGHCAGLSWKSLQEACDAQANEKGAVHFQRELRFAPVAGVRDVFWSPHWIPLLGSTLNDPAVQTVVFADFDPAEGGSVGQVVLKTVRWSQGAGYHGAERRVLAASLPAWLESIAADIEAGALLAGKEGFYRAS